MTLPQLQWFSLLPFSLVALVLLASPPAEAQVQAPECLPAAMPVWNWTYNSLNQSPCVTSAYLASQCSGGQFTIPQINLGAHYTGPSGPDDNDICKCNSVLYSTISACVGCQKGVWIPYDQWTANCTSVSPLGTFPQSITNNTRVPAWAFLNVSDSTPWNNVSACDFGGNPESVGTSRPSFAPQLDTGHALAAGAIAGAAAGGAVIALALVALGVWYLWRRHRGGVPVLPTSGRSSPVTRDDKGGYESVPFTPEPERKLYNPSDPSTFPKPADFTRSFATTTAASEQSALEVTPPNSAKLHQREYTGLPEI
ncbi:hypothetical protein BC834DRAFT_202391 [Gloeopeniophorella convolvens]|nr:hypothetical protein BC834DRAFT_202391 [Gloeopeniophorella convolvens]